jgi:hypothetical protein
MNSSSPVGANEVYPAAVTDTVSDDIREEIRSLFVGDRTLGDSFAPPLLFVAVNALWNVRLGAFLAIAAGAVVAIWRIKRGQQVIYAIAGIAAVVLAAFLAVRSGRAEDYFLPGIVSTGGWALGTLLSILVKRPLAAWTSWAYRRWPLRWYWRPDVRPAYSFVSWYWFAYFAVRGGVSLWLYLNEQPAILAVWKTVTSWPTILPLLYFTYRIGVERRNALGGPNIDEFRAGSEPPFAGGQRRF